MDNIARRPSDRRSDPRAQILKAAGEIFFREGFARSSVDMIAATARMSKQSIYELFPGKVALFEAAVRDALDMADRNLASVHPTDDIVGTLAQFGSHLFAGFAEPSQFGLLRANIVAANHFPQLADELHEHRLAMSRNFASYVERLMAAGRLVEGDPLSISIRFGGMAVGGIRHFLGVPLPGPAGRAAMIRAAIELYLDGYRAQALAADAERPSLPDGVAEPALEGTVALRLSPDKLAGLLDAAMDEFLDNAYPGASVDRIATRVRSSKATIYRQFGSKEKLFRYLIEGEIFASSRTQFSLEPAEGPPQEAIAALARRVLDWHLDPANIRIQRLLIQEADFIPDLARRFYEVRVAVVTRALDDLLRAHALPLPNAFAAEAFYALATFAVRFLTTRTAPDAARRDRYSQECARLFLNGVRAR